MKTYIIDYAQISPVVLADRVRCYFECEAMFHDLDEDYFELTVVGCDRLAELETFLAPYV